MSGWDNYTNAAMAGGNLSGCVIVGLADGAQWASTGPAIPAAEATALIARFVARENQTGAKLIAAGVAYRSLMCDEEVLNGKLDQTGICCVKTNQTMLVGLLGEGMNPGSAQNDLVKIADQLKASNF